MEQKPDAVQEVRQTLFTLRLIVFALATGLLVFIGYLLVAESGAARQQPRIWLLMAAIAGMMLVLRAVVPGIIFRVFRRKISQGTWLPGAKNGQPLPSTDEGLLMAALQTKTIIGCAFLEGAGYANAYAYMVEPQVVSLVITLALVLMVIAHFPLRFWLDGWLERQKRWLDEERSMRTLDRGTAP